MSEEKNIIVYIPLCKQNPECERSIINIKLIISCKIIDTQMVWKLTKF